MDTGQRSARPAAGGNAWTPSLPDVTAILASQQMPGLPSDAADRISRAIAAESAGRSAAAARETHTPIRVPRPRTGKELPPLIHVVPRPRQATAAA